MDKKYIILNECDHDFSSNMFYVYELIDPISNIVFYVGKGRDNRAWSHIQRRNHKKQHSINPHKCNKINKIIDSGNKVIVKISHTSADEQEAFDIEASLISYYGRACDGSGDLTNITNGGEGNTTDGRSVDQYTKFGEYIATYKNAKEAARILSFRNYSTICGCCRGRETSYMGFLWCYTGEIPTLLAFKKIVYQWTTDGILLDIHESIAIAARTLNMPDSSTISDCCRGKIATARGYIWTYDNITPVLKNNLKHKKILHINTGVVYDTITLASVNTKHCIGDICSCCKGNKASVGGDVFSYVN